MPCQVHTATLVPSDLRHEECLLQIADALDQLNLLSRSVTERISNRTAELRERLKDLQTRADVARAKIDSIRGTNKATKVFSSYKYPAAEGVREYVPAFHEDEEIFLPKQRAPRMPHVTPDEQVLKEKLQFFNVRTPAQEPPGAGTLLEGVGPLPLSTDSVCSLLLFNTWENPYTNYPELDPVPIVRKGQVEEFTSGPFLDAAPVSISMGLQGASPGQTGTFSYHPGLGQVPVMDVPLALPDLPGVADDLSYSVEQECPIAPSWPAGVDLPELPDVAVGGEIGTEPEPEPPEVPPPVVHIPVIEQVELPEVAPDPPATEEPQAVEKQVPVAEPVNDARASLLESIRQAGGRPKLRSAGQRREKAAPKVEPGGDLMSDLRSKLQLRRKGISGANQRESSPKEKETFKSPLDRMVSMIPAPPEDDGGDTTGTDEGWNDSD
uniref:Putative was protein family log 2 n=1 Tax=Ornithodoros turicata TaxID=34597 RepID=A0A2R5LK31_9ACAR